MAVRVINRLVFLFAAASGHPPLSLTLTLASPVIAASSSRTASSLARSRPPSAHFTRRGAVGGRGAL